MGVVRAHARRAQLDVRPRPRRPSTRCWASSGLQQAYFARDPGYDKRHHGAGHGRRPDRRRSSPTTSPSSRSTSRPSGPSTTAPGAPDLYPELLRDEIDDGEPARLRRRQQRRLPVRFRRLAGGVRHAPTSGCSTALDWLTERLADQRYLVGDTITEADVRLFTTLVRFDAVYHGHFKCNRQKLSELPVLWAYARDLFQTPGFGDTIDFAHIKRHYYVVHHDINPTRDRAARSRPPGLAHAARPGGARRSAVRRRQRAGATARARASAGRPRRRPRALRRGRGRHSSVRLS